MSPTTHLFPLLTAAALAAAAGAQDPNAPGSGGFLTGLKGFEAFHEPLGQPIYFESALNDTSVRALYLKHEFGNQSALQGGDVTIYAVQARVALTERLGFIATKDGYSQFDSGLIADQEGWNDLAGGFKYVVIADAANDFALTPGVRYLVATGNKDVLQGRGDEWSPFVSAAKGFGSWHALANATLRLPTDGDKGNTVGHWDLHVDYDVNPGAHTVFSPLVEVHGVHYLDDGATALPIGGLDYTNLGSQPAESFVCWAGVGARVEIGHKVEFGVCYEFALTDPDDDIMDTRITADFILRW